MWGLSVEEVISAQTQYGDLEIIQQWLKIRFYSPKKGVSVYWTNDP